MAISSANADNEIKAALATNSSRFILDKATIASQAAGTFVSLWRATGQPGQGAIPGAAAVCDNTLTGCFGFNQQTSPMTSYLGWASGMCGNSATTLEIHDRLMHMGGLSGTSVAAQTVGIDISANLATSNLDTRKGDANYSDVQWWLEWYTATGSTAVTATVAVTYNDGSTGNLTGAALAATRPASFMLPLNSLIPAAKSGFYIKAVGTVTNSATTGTAGSFGVTATKPRTVMPLELANYGKVFDWAALGIPEIANGSCLFPLVVTGGTSTGTLRGGGKIAHI